MNNVFLNLKDSLIKAAKKGSGYGLLFSGGLDSSVLAAINPQVKAINVSLESHGEDILYASYMAKIFRLDYYHEEVQVDEAIEIVPEVIRILKTFDPALPNDIVVYFGLKKAKKMGIKRVMAGDGSDELFAGYSFMQKMDNLEKYIEKISWRMRFSSNDIAEYFDMDIDQPYLEEKIINLALSIPGDLKIRKDSKKVWGKWILRKAFEDVLPGNIVWQTKRPLEGGSGMDGIREVISSRISDDEWKESERLPVKFINREHYYYYKIYREVVGDIPKPEKDEKKCPGCGAGTKTGAFHCKTCGYVSDWRVV